MNRKRVAQMDKAREKHNRKIAKKGVAKEEGISEKMMNLTQGALGTVGSLVRSTAQKVKDLVTSPAPAQK